MSPDDSSSIVVRRRRTYAIVYDDQFHEGMSARAWGVYCRLLSFPDGWEARATHLKTVFSEGRDALQTSLSELVTLGLLTKEKYLVDGLQRTRYVLDGDQTPRPKTRRSGPETDSQGPGIPAPEIPGPEDPAQVSTDRRSTEVHTPAPAIEGTLPIDVVTPRGATETAPTESNQTLDEQFADLWAIYPRKIGKQEARRVWDRVRRTTDPAVILDGARRYAAHCTVTAIEKRFIPHPKTWLGRGGWEDELEAVQPASSAPVAGAWAFMQGQTPSRPGSSVWDREPTRAARPAPRLTDAEIRDRALNPGLYAPRSA